MTSTPGGIRELKPPDHGGDGYLDYSIASKIRDEWVRAIYHQAATHEHDTGTVRMTLWPRD